MIVGVCKCLFIIDIILLYMIMECYISMLLFRTIALYIIISLSVFFFSSRRRHTRSLCDWSSDVCSSDLPDGIHQGVVFLAGLLRQCRIAETIAKLFHITAVHRPTLRQVHHRSEKLAERDRKSVV